MEVRGSMGKRWHLFPGAYRDRCIRSCLKNIVNNEDYTFFYDDGIFQFEQKKDTLVVCSININVFYEICDELSNRSEICNRINDFILQQLYLKSTENE